MSFVETYDSPNPYDQSTTYDGPESPPPPTLEWYFTVPTTLINPPFLPDTPKGPALSLFRHYTPRAVGVNVFILSDNTVVQDLPTPENGNTNVPYPWDPYYLPPTPFARVYDWNSVETDFHVNPYIVQVFYGGHQPYIVGQATYDILIAAGYADSLEPV